MLRRAFLIPAGIVVFWMVMTGLLLRDEVFVNRAAPHLRPAHPTETYMGIYTPGGEGRENRVGYLRTLSKPENRNGDPGTAYAITFRLTGTMLGIPAELEVNGRSWSSLRDGVSDFDFSISSNDQHMMRAEGKFGDGSLHLLVHTAGEEFPMTLPIGRNALFSGSMGSTLFNLPALDVGDEVIVDAFDPMTLSSGKARVKCIGRETLDVVGRPMRTKVITTEHAGVTTKVWVSEANEIVRIETPFGFIMRKISEEEALNEFDFGDSAALLDRLAVSPSGLVPVRGAQELVIRFANVDPDFVIPEDNRQRKTAEDLFQIRSAMEPGGAAEGIRLPDDTEDYLASDAFVQSDHPLILAQAGRITEGADGAWEKVHRIYEWVHESISKTVVLSFPSALEVLQAREGDCNEHTVLFTSLSRASGIPTRIAVGLVWSETLQAFYYHAWPEVWTGRWVAVDPTLGQPLADATHIKLVEGSIESWPRLVPFLGRLQIEVMTVD